MHDQTAVRTEGIAEQLHQHPTVEAEVDEGYRGLANEFPGQASAPPKKPKDDAPPASPMGWGHWGFPLPEAGSSPGCEGTGWRGPRRR